MFHGPNPLAASYLLAALRAAERLAEALGEGDQPADYRTAYERAAARTDQLLWGGDYYVQRLDDIDAHPYQHGSGCLSDQMLGQLHASLLGLGHLLPRDHVRSALASIHRHNFRRGFRDHVNAQRTYVLGDESGLLMCSWPDGGEPEFPFVYSDEVWTGTRVPRRRAPAAGGDDRRGRRDRHRGTGSARRRPAQPHEVECGHHYVRSMSSFALLLAATGFHCDLHQGYLSFAPPAGLLDGVVVGDELRAPWFAGRAWGTYRQRHEPDGTWTPHVDVLGGDLTGVRVRACGRERTL